MEDSETITNADPVADAGEMVMASGRREAPVGAETSAADVRAVREAQQALQRSRERYELLVEETREYAMFTMDEEGHIDTWNAGAERILGYKEEEIVGRPAALIYTPEDREAGDVARELRVAREEGQAMNERWHVRKDGSRFWGSGVVTSLWDNGHLRGYAKVMRDNTARRQAEEALRRSEERLRKIFEITTVGIIFFDKSGAIVDANDTFLKMVGFTRSDIEAGKLSWQKLTPPQWVDDSLGQLQKLQQTGAIGPYEKEYYRKDGSRCWFLFAGVALDDGGIFEFAIDISDQKRAEEALRRREQELSTLTATLEERVQERTHSLQQRTDEVRALGTQLSVAEQEERNRIAQVLHDDLQQRLYALQLQFAFLCEAHETGDEETFRQEAAAIEQDLHEVVRSTRQLSTDLSPPILYNEGLREAVSWLASHVQEQFGLQVTVDANESFTVSNAGLRVLLFQSVRELLFNVVKHANTSRASVSLERVDGSVRISVQDSGQGFDGEAVQACRRAGMGLATLQHRLKLVDGELHIETQPGAGARVEIIAPLSLESSS